MILLDFISWIARNEKHKTKGDILRFWDFETKDIIYSLQVKHMDY
jgi:hypothetical protein